MTTLINETRDINDPLDRELLELIQDFIDDADPRELRAFFRQRGGSNASQVLRDVREIIKRQQIATTDYLLPQLSGLIDSEVEYITKAMGETEVPTTRGVDTLPISGQAPTLLIAGAFGAYAKRLIAEITQAAVSAPDTIARMIRGTRAEQYRDGLFKWRDNRLIIPNIDTLVNGGAANADNHVYEAYRVEKVNHLATLDYRVCPRCYTAEVNGPYELGRAPALPVHPRCRCVNTPHIEGLESERPFVRDDRSVKNIPKSERGNGKIGRTRDSIDEFFGRMSKADRREYMGKTRAELWEQGKIDDIKDLVNQRTLRPLTLDQLPRL